MAIGVINFTADGQIYDLNLRDVIFQNTIEVMTYGNFDTGQITLNRVITVNNIEYSSPQIISWTNQTTPLIITDPVSGLDFIDLAHEGIIRFTFVGGTAPDVKLFLLGVGKSFEVNAI